MPEGRMKSSAEDCYGAKATMKKNQKNELKFASAGRKRKGRLLGPSLQHQFLHGTYEKFMKKCH